MKLISLYIENFGGLSQYSLTFEEGVTVVAAPNGFGKTTLAEFIRAMFYGFPRKTKTLDKSKRQKYTPWNGGKCGGNLVFELEDRRYRVERTFGATPKSDTFKVINLETNKKCDRFPEEIGLELFQLDADSFERSTYMPQLSGNENLSTNSIQAKLTRLVEDAGDINNFDRAMETLRGKRSAFVPYRGSGGTVAEARNRISQLQQELDSAQGKREMLRQCQENLHQLEAQLSQCEASIDAVRQDITAASEAAAAAALRREYEQLLSRKQADLEELERLGERYPSGVPDPEQIDEAEQLARQLAVLEGRVVTGQADLDAKAYVEQNRQRFEGRIPDQQQLEQRRHQHRRAETLFAEAQSIGLSEQERTQYEYLLPLYESGKLDPQRLETLSRNSRELEKRKNALEHTVMEPADQEKLDALTAYFAPGVPAKSRIMQLREDLKTCQQLRQENAQLAAAMPVPQPRKAISPVPLIAVLVLGLGAGAAGVAMLIQKLFVWGGILLGTGILGLIAGIFLGIRMMVSRELSDSKSRINPELQARIEANRIRLRHLEENITEFTGRYSAQKDPSDAIREIEDRAEDFETLLQRKNTIDARRDTLLAEASELENGLRRELPGDVTDFDRAVMELYLYKEQFADLQSEKQQTQTRQKDLMDQVQQLRDDLTAYLSSFYEDVQPQQFGALLARLQRESEAYLRCKAQVKTWEQRCREHEYECAECIDNLDRFFRSCCRDREPDVLRQLNQMRNDADTVLQIFSAGALLNRRLEAMRREHGDLLTAPQPEQIGDLDTLKWQERQMAEQQSTLTRRLLQERQNRIQLRSEVDRIPALQDELASWNDRKNTDQKKAALLDDTMAFLEKAKDSLSCSYLGPIREHFDMYMTRLTGMEQQPALISPELEVQLERQGQARELAFFSAGQTDLVMLCMRLALVDALFTDVKPFIILDDPFVNLDDERTAQALQLLQELGKERQILYLVCNSSRSF